MSDIRELMPPEPEVRVVVVQVRHPFPRPAAEFADVVPGGTAGHQGQVHGDPGLSQSPAHGHGDVMHPRNMLQRPERRDLQAQTHHLIHILPLP